MCDLTTHPDDFSNHVPMAVIYALEKSPYYVYSLSYDPSALQFTLGRASDLEKSHKKVKRFAGEHRKLPLAKVDEPVEILRISRPLD